MEKNKQPLTNSSKSISNDMNSLNRRASLRFQIDSPNLQKAMTNFGITANDLINKNK